jgi:hypothetical protein
MLLGSKLRRVYLNLPPTGWMERERSALQRITSTAMEGAIPPCVLEGSSSPREWKELVGWVLGELVRLPTG